MLLNPHPEVHCELSSSYCQTFYLLKIPYNMVANISCHSRHEINNIRARFSLENYNNQNSEASHFGNQNSEDFVLYCMNTC